MKTHYYLNVCRRLKKADIVLKNARIVNVFTKEILSGDLALCDDKIIGIGDYKGEQEIDLQGKYVVPGFIDGHVHIESSMISPCEFAKTVLPFGTTTLIADPHEIANVSGLMGIEYMLEKSKDAPISIYYMLPSCVPATMMESSGAILEAEHIAQLINHPQVLGLGEVMNYPGVILGDQGILNKIQVAKGKVVDGHAPGLTGYDLTAYAFAGIHTDHECSTIQEALERIRVGMTVQIRKGSAANNLYDLVSGLVEKNLPLQNCIFCTDDKHLEDIIHDGHINSNIRESIKLGISPVEAICMATLYPAKTYNLTGKGALAPGYDADLVILDSLEEVTVDRVMVGGKWQYDKEHQPKATIAHAENRFNHAATILNTVHCDTITTEALEIPLAYPRVHVMELLNGQILTRKVVEKVNVVDGVFKPCATYSKITVLERHHRTGNKALGIVKNFGIQGGAIAQTIAHDSHNIICIGDNDEDMALAINTLIEKQGGIVVASKGKVADHLNLPIGGLMSTLSATQVIHKLSDLLACAKALHINPYIDPFLTLAFLALPVIPDIKITDKGLFDVTQFKHIPLEA
ncbi:MAG: adenine deaminase [Cellulosilyticaceae bacterium]